MAINLDLSVIQVGNKKFIFLVLPNEEHRELGKLHCHVNQVTKKKTYSLGFSESSKLGALADEIGLETMRAGIKTIGEKLLALPDQDELLGEYLFTAEAINKDGYTNPKMMKKI